MGRTTNGQASPLGLLTAARGRQQAHGQACWAARAWRDELPRPSRLPEERKGLCGPQGPGAGGLAHGDGLRWERVWSGAMALQPAQLLSGLVQPAPVLLTPPLQTAPNAPRFFYPIQLF